MNWTSQRIKLLGQTENFQLPPNFRLPSLPKAVQEFAKAAEAEDADVGELSNILESDSGLTAEVLQLVNSSVYGLRTPARSVRHALSLIGISKTKNILLTTSAQKAFSRCESKMINLQHFWHANIERALFAREVALLAKADAEVAYSASILQDLLLPILTNEFYEKFTAFQDRQRNHPELITKFEQREFCWDHAVACAHVAYQWGFPDELICCLYEHHQGLSILMQKEYLGTSVVAVALSSLIPDVIGQTPGGLNMLRKLPKVWRVFDLESIAQRVEQEFQKMVPASSHHFSLRRRLEKLTAEETAAV